MIKFYTKYDRVKQQRSKLDPKDNVDRLSYVDSTRMVQRMILEGQNLNAYRAAAQRAGMYRLQDLETDEKVPAMPVYEEDPVIMQGIQDIYKDELTASTTNRTEEGATVEAGSTPAENVTSDSQGGE